MPHQAPTTTPSVPAEEAAAPPARTPYFVYGSLMSPTVLHTIINPANSSSTPSRSRHHLKHNQMSRATLHQHKRHIVKYADYPAVFHTGVAEDHVKGFLVEGLTQSQEECIEAFESGLYKDVAVQVSMGWGDKGEGEKVLREARVYVWGGRADELLPTEVREWSFKAFKKSHMYSRFSWGGESSGSEGEGVDEVEGGE